MYKDTTRPQGGYGTGSTSDKYEGGDAKEYAVQIVEMSQDEKNTGSVRDKALSLFSGAVLKKSGSVVGSPGLYNGRLYIGCNDFYFYCLNAKTGEFEWKFKCNGPIMSYVHVSNGIYFTAQDKYIYALSPDGDLLWKFERKSNFGSSAVVCSGVLYAGSGWDEAQMSELCLYALDSKKGALLWKFSTNGPISSAPAIINDTAFFGSGDRHFYAVSTKDGKLKWKFQTSDGIDSSPCIADMSGREIWSIKNQQKDMKHIDEGIVYFGSWDNNIYALTLDGKELWRYRLNGPVMFSSPTVCSGTVFMGCLDNYLYALDALTGQLKWKFQTNMSVVACPVVHKDTVYVGSTDKHLYAISLDGKMKWKYETNGFIASAVTILDDVVYLTSWDGYVRALNLDGKLLWEYKAGSMVSGDLDAVAISSQISQMNKRILRLWSPETIKKSHFSDSVIFRDHVTLGANYNSMNMYASETSYSATGSYERGKKKGRFGL